MWMADAMWDTGAPGDVTRDWFAAPTPAAALLALARRARLDGRTLRGADQVAVGRDDGAAGAVWQGGRRFGPDGREVAR